MRPLVLLLVVALASVIGCGGGEPPDRATSEAQIKELVPAYQSLIVEGKGEEACAFVVDQSLEGMPAEDMLPAGVDDCASYWSWLGPKLSPPGRDLMLTDRVSTVEISGKTAVATMVSGAPLDLKWVDGRWKLGT